MLAAKCHLGSQNLNSKMKNYEFARRADGIHILHIGKTWEKLMLAARVLAITAPEVIYVTFAAVKNRRPAIKLAQYLGANCNQGRFVPGTFTNTLVEPTLLVCMDPSTDHQAVTESSHCAMPVIAFVNSHSSLKYVDIAIPCNNLGAQSIGVMSWLLARTVLRLRGVLNYVDPWDVLPDMFFYSEELIADAEEEYGDQSDALGPRYGRVGLYGDQQPSVGGGNWNADSFGTQKVNTTSWSFKSDEGEAGAGGGGGGGGWDDSNEFTQDTIKIQFESNTSSWGKQSVNQPLPSSFGFDQHEPSASIDWADDIPKDDEEEHNCQ
jgi:small subunit ribosomal protein SAe